MVALTQAWGLLRCKQVHQEMSISSAGCRHRSEGDGTVREAGEGEETEELSLHLGWLESSCNRNGNGVRDL